MLTTLPLNSDAADVYGSTLFVDLDPTSGLGGWGDPSHDYEVPTGGFSNFHLSYPSSHTLRRNFTLQPYLNTGNQFFMQPKLEANTSFTIAEVNKLVGGFKGDFKGFQTYFERWEVRCC
jgi:tyrosinase